MEDIFIDGFKFHGYTIPAPHVDILVIRSPRGMLGCGYLNLAAAEKFKDGLAIVSGVSTYEEMLAAKVTAVSPEAAEMGVRAGMTGREALLHMC